MSISCILRIISPWHALESDWTKHIPLIFKNLLKNQIEILRKNSKQRLNYSSFFFVCVYVFIVFSVHLLHTHILHNNTRKQEKEEEENASKHHLRQPSMQCELNNELLKRRYNNYRIRTNRRKVF